MATTSLATPHNAKRPALPQVRHGRRGDEIACDCCDKPAPDKLTCLNFPRWVWTEREVGPASFAWVTCPDCGESGAAQKMHWTEKVMRRANRHGKTWAKAVEAMIMRGYN